MPNEYFNPTYSTDNIWREQDMERCLSDDLNTIEADIAALETGKAAATHTHTGYAAASDVTALQTLVGDTAVSTQIASAITGKADVNHTHTEYAAADHNHSGYASTVHIHSYNDLSDKPTIPTALPANGGNADTVDGKHASEFATASHTHTDKADLVNGAVPASQMPSTVVTLDKLANIMSAHHVLTTTITKGDNYSSVTGSVTLIGNMLRVTFSASRNSIASGNIDNEVLASFSIAHGGKILGGYAVTFNGATSGHVSSMNVNNVACDETNLTFNVKLNATAGDTSSINAYFAMPVIIDLSKY